MFCSSHPPLVCRAALPRDKLSSHATGLPCCTAMRYTIFTRTGLPCCTATRYTIFTRHWSTTLHCHTIHYLQTSLVYRAALRMPHDTLSSYATAPHCTATRYTIFIRQWSTVLHCHTIHYLHPLLVNRTALRMPHDALSSYSAFRQKFPKLWTSVAHSFFAANCTEQKLSSSESYYLTPNL